MSRKPAPTLADYVVVAISPALIMLLVGSLVFFLTNIFYEGEFHGRLRFSCAMFVMAAVLIARISIEEGREYAGMFALPLAVVTMLSILRYTDAGFLLALPLIVAIWWSTDKLTWDCTVIEDHKDASGEGLLQTIGLDSNGPESSESQAKSLDLQASTASARAEADSFWQKWLAKRRRHHTPGVWVAYFSLASLPLFGLGQWLLPDTSAAKNSSLFLLCIYVTSALALLMTTSFLQLRRYLRQRRLQMPSDMARVWLGTGTMIIVGLVFVCLLLPLPNTRSSLSESVARLASRDNLRSSRLAIGDEGIKDEGRSNSREPDSSQDSDPQDGVPSRSKNEENSQQRQTDSTDGNESSADAETKSTEEQQTSEQPSPDPPKSRSAPDEQNESSSSDNTGNRDADSTDSQQNRGREPEPSDQQSKSKPPTDQDARSTPPPKPSSPPSGPLPNLPLGSMAKWLYWLVLGVVVGGLLWRYWHEVASAIRAFLRDLARLWARLFGREDAADVPSDEETMDRPPLPRPFASYRNPFAAGASGQQSPQQLVRYSFEALQAWAHERNCAKLPEQTPLEFALFVGGRDKRVGSLARNLAALYNQVAYANDPLPSTTTDQLRQLWAAMQA